MLMCVEIFFLKKKSRKTNLNTFLFLQLEMENKNVAIPHWAKWENATPTPKSGKLGVLRDSQKFKRQFEGSNLLTLARSLCH
jgi:hypothetical protein